MVVTTINNNNNNCHGNGNSIEGIFKFNGLIIYWFWGARLYSMLKFYVNITSLYVLELGYRCVIAEFPGKQKLPNQQQQRIEFNYCLCVRAKIAFSRLICVICEYEYGNTDVSGWLDFRWFFFGFFYFHLFVYLSPNFSCYLVNSMIGLAIVFVKKTYTHSHIYKCVRENLAQINWVKS